MDDQNLLYQDLMVKRDNLNTKLTQLQKECREMAEKEK